MDNGTPPPSLFLFPSCLEKTIDEIILVHRMNTYWVCAVLPRKSSGDIYYISPGGMGANIIYPPPTLSPASENSKRLPYTWGRATGCNTLDGFPRGFLFSRVFHHDLWIYLFIFMDSLDSFFIIGKVDFSIKIEKLKIEKSEEKNVE